MEYVKNTMDLAEKQALEVARMETEALKKTANIAFVVMAEKGDIDDTTAMENIDVFAPWQSGIAYKQGDLRTYGEGEQRKLYRCVQAHTSQDDWTPPAAASLWALTADPAEEWPAWSQPIGAHDAYEKGAKCSHNGKHWVSDVDNNVWEPGAYGWTEAED